MVLHFAISTTLFRLVLKMILLASNIGMVSSKAPRDQPGNMNERRKPKPQK